MKTKITVLLVGLLIPFLSLAGEFKMIKQFDKVGLKDLNNQLKKQEKLIQKLMKQGGAATTTKSVQSQDDFVSETVLEGAGAENSIERHIAYGVPGEDGRLELFDGSNDESTVINIEPTSFVGKTQAQIAIPSSYFLDLRGIYKSSTTQQYTADVLVVHDASGNTITLTSVDETNSIATAGPAAGKRDQAAAFGDGVWVHVYVVYNPVTGDTSSLSSLSPTAPTLTGDMAGYTYYCRVGAIFVYDVGGGLGIIITLSHQMDNKVIYNPVWVKWDTNNDSYTSVDLGSSVPTTAKIVHGVIGLSDGTTTRKMAVASDSGGLIKVGGLCDAQGAGDKNYGVSGSKDFSLPLMTAQTIWWKTETTGNVYALGITGFTDDL